MLYAIVAILVIIADQWVKYWVAASIPMDSLGETFLPGIISLVNLHNDGAAFSFLSGGGARIYFILITGVFTVAVILALATNFISGKVGRWSIVMVTAGGLSNCIDRIIYGYVQDMFKVELFNFPVFNLADVFITVFCLVFIFAVIFEKDKKDDDYDDEFQELDDEDADRPRRKTRAEKKAEAAAAGEAKPSKLGLKRKNKVDEYEQFKAARAARPQAPAPAPAAKRPAPQVNSADPFAEWERANARVEAQQKNSPAARASGMAPRQYSAPRPQAPRPAAPPAAAPARQPVRRPVAPAGAQRPAEPMRRPVPPPPPAAPAAPRQPVQPVQPPQAPVQPPVQPMRPPVQNPAPRKPSTDMDFSLDDILEEFK